jgi:Fe2+ or Zn2+ uptake regulation protein
MAILQCLDAAHKPQSAADVASHLSAFGFDKSTIYRALSDLHEAKLITRLELGDGPRHFELSAETGHALPAHPHFVCTECHKVFCLELSQVAIKSGTDNSELPGEVTEVFVKGRCTDCQ